MKGIIINATCNGYSMSQASSTMTVGDLISILDEYDDDMPVFIGNDRQSYGWYTYGRLSESDIEVREEKPERTYMICEECWSWDGEWLDGNEVEDFFDESEATVFAFDMNEKHFRAWSDYDSESGQWESKYIAYCIKVFDEEGNIIDVIESEELGGFKK